MDAENTTKTQAKPTGRRYSSVKDLMRGEGVSQEIQTGVAKLASETRVTKQLACMRHAADLTQAQMAKRMGVTQSAISKIEAGVDEDLSLNVIREYCQAADSRIGVMIGKPLNHVEAVKNHFQGLRHHLTALAELTQGDQGLESNIQKFFSEALFNILNIFEKLQPENASNSPYEITVETQDVVPLPKKLCAQECSDLTPQMV